MGSQVVRGTRTSQGGSGAGAAAFQSAPPFQSSACNLRRGATPELPARTRGYLISGANDHWFVGSWASFSIRAIRPPHFPTLPALLCGSTQPAFSVSGRVILQLPGCWCVVVCSCHPACPLVLLSEIHCLKSCGFAAGWGVSCCEGWLQDGVTLGSGVGQEMCVRLWGARLARRVCFCLHA